MKIFIDSADIDEIKSVASIIDGVTTNPTLLRSAIEKRKGVDLEGYIRSICETAGEGKPVSLEVASTDADSMIREATFLYEKFNGVSGNVVVKIPVSTGNDLGALKAIREVSSSGIPVNATLIMTPTQALLAAKSGATYVSPFVGRVDDYVRANLGIKFKKDEYFDYSLVQEHKGKNVGRGTIYSEDDVKLNNIENNFGILSGVDLVRRIKVVFSNYGIRSKIIAASIRNLRQLMEVMEVGAEISTVPYEIIMQMLAHPKTYEGVKIFADDAKRASYGELFSKGKNK